MPTLAEYPFEVREGLATWQLLRRLGFTNDHLDTGVIEDDSGYWTVVQIAVQGRTCVIRICPTEVAPAEFQAHWSQLAESIGDIPEEDMQSNWDGSLALRNKVSILAGLVESHVFWPTNPRFNSHLL